MIQVSNLSKSYGSRFLFEDLSFAISSREVIGLVGRNGCGKSTLTKIILGFESADEGTVSIPKGYRIGHLDQHIKFSAKELVDEVVLALAPEERMMTYKAEKILFGLGFTKEDLKKDPMDFSGGYQLRINLAKCLINSPDLLVLDEPTNYLDILSIKWMKSVLNSYPGEVILITHDKAFMDSVITHTMGIHRGLLRKMKGKTGKYYEQLILDEDIHNKTRDNQIRKKKDLEKFVEKFRAKASKATQAQSKMKQIEKLDIKDELYQEAALGFKFSYKETHAKTLAKINNLSFGYGNAENLFEGLNIEIKSTDRVGVIGKNGKGKTTLLNVVAEKLEKRTGSIELHPTSKLGYYQQTNRKDLNPNFTVADEIASENINLPVAHVRGICGAMMFSGSDADKKIKVLSGGEQSRVLLGKVLANPSNLLLLDEPTNHLDIESIDALIKEVVAFKGGALFVTHNEEFLDKVANKLIVFKAGKAHVFNGTYKEFLDKEGWEDEEIKPDDSPTDGGDSDGALAYKKQKKINHYEKQLEKIGEKVMKAEEKISEIETSLSGDWEKDQNLYSEIKKHQKTVESLYKEMEGFMSEIERLSE